MTLIEIILIGIALSMDAFALTIANCTTYSGKLTPLKEWAMPTSFGIFQFLMPVVGYYLGSAFSGYLTAFSGYLTAGIFFVLAVKIVIDNLKEMREKEEVTTANEFSFSVLILQSVATAIDALAVGVSFAVGLNGNVFFASAIIGITTFIIVCVALFIGKTLGKVLGKYATWAGAVILFALAIKNLITAII